MRSPSFYLAYLVRKIWALLALCLVVIAVLLSVLRSSLPYLDHQKHLLEDYLSERFETQLKIGSITAKWHGTGPAMVLKDVSLVQTTRSPVQLDIAETVIELNFWDSILEWQVQSNKFDLEGLRITVDVSAFSQKNDDYPIVKALEKLFLQQLQSFSISNSSISILTPNDSQTVLIDQVSWFNKEERHQGKGQLQIEEIARNSASFVIDLYGKEDDLSGTFFAEGEELDLSPWINQWLHTSYELTESRGSFVMWASIAKKSLTSVQLDLSNSRFSWEVDNEKIEASVLGGQINAAPDTDGWVMNVNNLSLQINQQLSNTNWRAKLDSDGTIILANVEPIGLAPYAGLFPLIIDESASERVKHLQPTGVLDKLQLGFSLLDGLNIDAQFSELSWKQYGAIPGFSQLSANLLWSNDHGKVDLKSNSSTLFVDDNLPQNVDYEQFSASLYLATDQDGLSISSDDIILRSKELTVYPQFYYRSNDQFLALSANIAPLNVADIEHYYPAELMGKDTQRYLSGALKTGTVTGAQLLWNGSLKQFPFKQHQGIFQANVDIQQAQFLFDSHWPALTELDINLLFENEGLWMQSLQGKLEGVKLTDLHAVIPSLSAGAVLTIDAKGLANGQEVQELMAQSSLANSLGQALQQVQIQNQVEAQLNLVIPLAKPEVVASGTVSLNNSNVFISSLGLQFEDAQGQVSFVNDKVNFEGLQAKLLGQPVVVGFQGGQQEQGYQVGIDLTGNWQIAPLLSALNLNFSNRLTGSSQWQANVALTLPAEGYEYSANITSNLKSVASTFPAPFDKIAQQNQPLNVQAKGNKQASTVKVALGDDIVFNGNLPHESMQFSRAHLAIGESDMVGMGIGFSISANVKQLDSIAWYQTIDALLSNNNHSGDKPSILNAPKRIFIRASNASFAGHKLTNLELVAKNTDESWSLDVNAKEARMEVQLYKDWLAKGIKIKADYIETVGTLEEESDEVTDTPLYVPNPETFPPIDFSCQRCTISNNELGKIDFVLTRSANGMHIDSLSLNNNNGLLKAEGDWFAHQGKSSTRLIGDFSSSDFGAFLKGFQFNSGVKDSKANTTFDLSWQDAPHKFNFATLNGNMDWRLSDGYLTEVTDKGARIFSILSLDSLVRKLKLDFRDVFAKGFFYDKMTGSFQIQNGIVETRDTEVDGGAGEINMLGFTDLNTQQLNYQISFVPNVTSSLPVIVAWMVNPATALAALALDQVLTSAKVISNIKFSITGTLDEPVIEELGRDSKEITLPARTNLKKQTPKLQGRSVESLPVSLTVMPEELIDG